MSLKRRLERLAAALPAGREARAGAAEAALSVAEALQLEGASSPGGAQRQAGIEPRGRSPQQRTIEDLRRQLDAMLARAERPARPPRAATDLSQLPFVSRPTPSGALVQRLEQLDPEHHVGNVPVRAACSADPRVLADLSLTPEVAACDSRGDWLFIDTETTGLGGSGALVFLVGMARLAPSGAVEIEQLLLAEPVEEAALLERLRACVLGASLLVSFNGKAFDRPMLESRIVLNRLPALPARPHLDLLHVGRRLHRQRLGQCTLKRVEREVLGFDRGDDIDGSEVGPLYSHFLRTGDAGGLSAVVAHNYWDVVSMVALVGLYGQRLPALAGQDLAGLARTLERAGATHHAEHIADIACERGGGIEAFRVRAELAKRRGDCLGAVRDFERLCATADDPRGRLELAKLYEHKLREPARALSWAALGTNEDVSAAARRRERLLRKLERPLR